MAAPRLLLHVPAWPAAGLINEQGFIACNCPKCGGRAASCSEFEEHSGSRDRRPADGIFLTCEAVLCSWPQPCMLHHAEEIPAPDAQLFLCE